MVKDMQFLILSKAFRILPWCMTEEHVKCPSQSLSALFL